MANFLWNASLICLENPNDTLVVLYFWAHHFKGSKWVFQHTCHLLLHVMQTISLICCNPHSSCIKSAWWLLMPWCHVPGHQQPPCWLCPIPIKLCVCPLIHWKSSYIPSLLVPSTFLFHATIISSIHKQPILLFKLLYCTALLNPPCLLTMKYAA